MRLPALFFVLSVCLQVCGGSIDQFEKGVRGKLDTWHSSFNSSMDKFENNVKSKGSGEFNSNNSSGIVNRFKSSVQGKFDRFDSQFGNAASSAKQGVKNGSSTAKSKLEDDTKKLSKDLKDGLKDSVNNVSNELKSEGDNTGTDYSPETDTLRDDEEGLEDEIDSDIEEETTDDGDSPSDPDPPKAHQKFKPDIVYDLTVTDTGSDHIGDYNEDPWRVSNVYLFFTAPVAGSYKFCGPSDVVIGSYGIFAYASRALWYFHLNAAHTLWSWETEYGYPTCNTEIRFTGKADVVLSNCPAGKIGVGPNVNFMSGKYYIEYLGPAGTADDGTSPYDSSYADSGSSGSGSGSDSDKADTPTGDDKVDSTSTNSGYKTGISSLDKLFAKLSPNLTSLSGVSSSEFSLHVPLNTVAGDFSFDIGGWDTAASGSFNTLRSTLRQFSKFVFTLFFLLCCIRALRQW